MSKFKIIIIGLLTLSLCGCKTKFEGTWCLYNEVATTLIILKDDVSNTDIDNLTSYLNTLEDISSYDVIDTIDSANKMVNIYYKSKDKLDEYKSLLEKNKAVKSIENKMLNKPEEKVDINNKDYTYGKNLSGLGAKETKGKIKTKGDELIVGETTFYYKDSFLCDDKDCSIIFTKSNKDCND